MHLLVTSENGRRALASFLSSTMGTSGTNRTVDLLGMISTGSLESMDPRMLGSRLGGSNLPTSRSFYDGMLGPHMTGRVVAPCGTFFQGRVPTDRTRTFHGGPRTLMR